MKKYLYSLFALAAVLSSCTSDVEEAVSEKSVNSSTKYALTLEPFVYEGTTRINLTDAESSIVFGWSFNEVFGVFPLNPANSQARWELTKSNDCADDDHYALFNGEGWGLTEGVEYAAYHPYNGNAPSSTPYTAVPVSLPTTQVGTLDAIGGSYDYIYATGTYNGNEGSCPGAGNVIFNFNHAIAIVKIVMPGQSGTVSDVTLSSSQNFYVSSGTLNAGTGEVTAGSSASSVSLSSSTSAEDGNLEFYLALFPTTIENAVISFKVGGVAHSYSRTLNTKEFKKGYAYVWNLSKWSFE